MERQGGLMSQVWIERVGRNLRLLREERGWSQAYVAKRMCELSQDPEFYKGKEAISNIERGLSTPPWHKMLQLARFFETTIEALAELPTEGRHGPQTHAEVIYVQNMHGNCVLGGLGLAFDPEALEKLGDALGRHPELLAQMGELLRQWRTTHGASGGRPREESEGRG
jgi:transcriptional regulator with XRE-family HTH domain